MDEEPEVDDGYVTLVNAKYDKDGELVETARRTHRHLGVEASRTRTARSPTRRSDGDVRFFDVDFGYKPDKIVLHDITPVRRARSEGRVRRRNRARARRPSPT